MSLSEHYQKSQRRLLLLDYDGTLVDYSPVPEDARPTPQVLVLLSHLAGDPRNTVVIVSGRDRHTLENWLGELPVDLVAEHGLFHRRALGSWQATRPLDQSWKPPVRRLMESIQISGSQIEEKTMALVWHFRQCDDPAAASQAASALAKELRLHAEGYKVMEGNKIVEVTASGTDKGQAARAWLEAGDYDFILAAGDDTTDEDLFSALPTGAYEISTGILVPGRGALSGPGALLRLLDDLRK